MPALTKFPLRESQISLVYISGNFENTLSLGAELVGIAKISIAIWLRRGNLEACTFHCNGRVSKLTCVSVFVPYLCSFSSSVSMDDGVGTFIIRSHSLLSSSCMRSKMFRLPFPCWTVVPGY